jgi:hypothetical protein
MPGHKQRLAWIKAGLCGNCGAPRGEEGTKTKCRTHADEHSREQAARNQRARAERGARHQCLDCEEVLPKGQKYCKVHKYKNRKKHKDYYRKIAQS